MKAELKIYCETLKDCIENCLLKGINCANVRKGELIVPCVCFEGILEKGFSGIVKGIYDKIQKEDSEIEYSVIPEERNID